MGVFRLNLLVVIITIGGMPSILHCFNVDVRNFVMHKGPEGSAFGYKAEFIEETFGGIKLLVTVPKMPVLQQNHSGFNYVCGVQQGSKCTQHDSPLYQALKYSYTTVFGERDELFGLSLAMANQETAVMCGPLYLNTRYYNSGTDHSFTIGRCVIVRNAADQENITPYTNTNRYVDSSGFLDGMAMFGFAAAGIGDGNVVISSPSWKLGRGEISILDTVSKNVIRMDESLEDKHDVFQGYEIAVGKFCKGNIVCFATANRAAIGKVFVVQHIHGSRIPFQQLWTVAGEQEYSSFGSVLGAVDVNGDGWPDLLVGAPTFTANVNDSLSYDQGRVFVYKHSGEMLLGRGDNFQLMATLSGDEVQFARFGSAIAGIGDINRDSFEDVAVGAPLENEGSGAVYLYLGGPDGPANKHVQKILGRDFQPALKSFGSHISKPNTRISLYGYPDFAVGAPESATVVFLQTRLIINAQVKLTATPNPVYPRNDRCPSSVRDRTSGCFTLQYCLSFKHGADPSVVDRDFHILTFDLTIEVDSRLINTDSKRVRLNLPDGNTTTQLNVTVDVNFNRETCWNITALLRKEQIDRNPFVPMEVVATFRLNTTRFADQPLPILNQSRPDTQTYQVKFKNECGDDEKCQTDLSLSGQVMHVPDLKGQDATFNVINHTRQVELHFLLRNNREMAFGVKMVVNVSGAIQFRTATGNTTIICDQDDKPSNIVSGSDSGVGSDGGGVTQPTTSGSSLRTKENRRVLVCNSWTALGEGEAAEFRLQFLADSVPLEAENKVIRFDVKAMPADPTYNPEVKEEDNMIRLESQTVIMADLKITGWSDPRVVTVQDSDSADVALTHKLLLTNRGVSFLPPTNLSVTLPASTVSGSALVARANVTVKLPDGRVMECPHVSSASSTFDPFTTVSTTSTTRATTTTRARLTTTPASDGESTTSTLFPEIQPSKRRRRNSDGQTNAAEGDDQSVKSSDRMMRMDCKTYRCRVYQCSLPMLQPNVQLELNVSVSLQRSAISFPENIDTLYYVTNTGVAQPDHPLFYSWEQMPVREVLTPLQKISSGGDSINFWYIIGGILGGLLILLIIVLVAWKLGFFKRKDKARLEKLKRQSGFYETGGQRGSRRSKAASTSGSQRSAASGGAGPGASGKP